MYFFTFRPSLLQLEFKNKLQQLNPQQQWKTERGDLLNVGISESKMSNTLPLFHIQSAKVGLA